MEVIQSWNRIARIYRNLNCTSTARLSLNGRQSLPLLRRLACNHHSQLPDDSYAHGLPAFSHVCNRVVGNRVAFMDASFLRWQRYST
jgi:hypothetical protein